MILMGLLCPLRSRVYAHNSEHGNKMLHQPLADLSIGCFEVGVSGARASDIIPLKDNQLIDEVHGLMIMLCCWTIVY